MEMTTILWREWVFFKNRFFKITSSQLISPLLYLVTFGLGLGHTVTIDGQPYLYYLIPGILAMTTMRNSYSAVSMRISVARLHEKSFEMYLLAPMRMTSLAIGYVLAGAFRGIYAGSFILLIGLLVGAKIHISGWLIFFVFLNAVIFAELGFLAAMIIDTHYDMNRFTNMVITPMSFLCGTFFSVDSMPWYLKRIIEIFPLTHTSRLIRGVSFQYGIHGFSLLMAILYAAIILILCIRVCYNEIK